MPADPSDVTVTLDRRAVLLPAGIDVEVGSEWIVLDDDGRTLTAALSADYAARVARVASSPPVIQALATALEQGGESDG